VARSEGGGKPKSNSGNDDETEDGIGGIGSRNSELRTGDVVSSGKGRALGRVVGGHGITYDGIVRARTTGITDWLAMGKGVEGGIP
jgi:hypothetical protein